ncbi:hypothetical protein [Nocardia puris]|uniref:Uncharacterized protein n=1 Tax=Nocardia puris TaxID=208602 RepID=A0A366E4P7_9NOCA|nr:hypothetical protein [Nocardia puris]RBO97075.1 hypothetical protein DFR74_1011095 [Nocardia puris]
MSTRKPRPVNPIVAEAAKQNAQSKARETRSRQGLHTPHADQLALFDLDLPQEHTS